MKPAKTKAAAPAKMGRPTKLEKVDLEQVKALASLGLTNVEIGLALGISDRTVIRWNKKPDFCQALKAGKLKADAQVARALYESCLGDRSRGVLPNVTACFFWLKNRQADRWRDRRDTFFGSDGAGESSLRIEVVHVRAAPAEGGNGKGNGKGNGNGGGE